MDGILPDNSEQESPMSRIACTLLLASGLSLTACSKSPDSAGAAPTPKEDVAAQADAATKDLATPAGLTNELTSKLGISETQATAALGSVLGLAKSKLSPGDYSKLAGAIPGADKYLAMAPDIGGTPVPGQPLAEDSVVVAVPAVDSTVAGATDAAGAGTDAAAAGVNAAAAAGESAGMAALSSQFSKIGLPPEAAKQFVPVLTDYVGKVGGPEAANILKGLF
jgi:uncharacterized protein VcgC/VcgE DUF2780